MIPINRPDFSEEDLIAYAELRGRTGSNGEDVKRLETRFAQLFGDGRYALFTGSAKTALLLLFKALGLEDGEVITTPLTCHAALTPVVASGLTPFYADIDPDRMLMDESRALECINPNTKAILSVALGGCPGRMDQLIAIAKEANLPLIEDCAQALGSRYGNRLLGAFGEHAFFSFTKHFCLVGGGMLLSRSMEVIERARAIQNEWPWVPDGLLDYRYERDLIEGGLGQPEADEKYRRLFLSKAASYKETDPRSGFGTPGVLHRPSDLQAAMVLRQLSKLDDMVRRRRQHADRLKEALSLLPGVRFQADEGQSSLAKLYLRSHLPNEELIARLMEKGVDAKQLTKSHGMYLQKRIDQTRFLRHESVDHCTNYLEVHDHVVELPLSSKMTAYEIDRIIEATKESLL